MATNHTENYNLNLWEANDKFVREEFNENTNKLEAALVKHDGQIANLSSAKANQTALTALTQTVNTKARIAVGHYEGDGTQGRIISVGFTPKAVLLMTNGGQTYTYSGTQSYFFGGLAVENAPLVGTGNANALEIVPGGFRVTHTIVSGSILATNYSSSSFHYIALG